MSEVLIEPRALWDVVQTDAPITTAPVRTSFNNRHFTNGGAWPITINRIVLSPINYILQTQDGATVAGNSTYNNSMAVLNEAKILVSAPFRKSFSRYTFSAQSMPAEPTASPSPLTTAFAASDLFGISRMEFDHPLVLPRLGTIDMAITGFSLPNIGINFGTGGAGQNVVAASMAYYELGGQLSGSCRLRPRQFLFPMLPANQPWGNMTDGFGTYANVSNNNPYLPGGAFTGKLFDQENATRSGSSALTGIGIALDQLTYDGQQGTAVGSGISANPAAPICTRVGVRIRTVSGGTDTFWWRPGAPLSLVFDACTPGLVFRLAEPITLPPGDSLKVELETPGLTTINDTELDPQYNIGISFNGYAIISG